jgi:GNAT superfamily N-acetyltransferase
VPEPAEFLHLDSSAAIDVHGEIIAVYRSVFTRPPFNDSETEVGGFAEEFVGDVRHPEFRCFTARRSGELVGFAYGFRTFTDQPWNPWYEEILRSVGPAVSDSWIRGRFAVGWLAVLEQHRGHGIGAALHDELVASGGPTRWWLVTHDLDSPARRLYQARGWVELGRGPLGWGKTERLVLGLDREDAPAP